MADREEVERSGHAEQCANRDGHREGTLLERLLGVGLHARSGSRWGLLVVFAPAHQQRMAVQQLASPRSCRDDRYGKRDSADDHVVAGPNLWALVPATLPLDRKTAKMATLLLALTTRLPR